MKGLVLSNLTPLIKKKSGGFEGEKFPYKDGESTISAACKPLNISKGAVRERMKNNQCDLETAIDLVRLGSNKGNRKKPPAICSKFVI